MLNTYPKTKVIDTITSLNRQILKDFIRLKQQFQSKTIPNNQISNQLKTWKPIFQQSLQQGLAQIKHFCINQNPNQQFHCSSLVKELTRTYSADQQYTEAIKCLNSTTDMIKDYIRIKAIKDPTTAVLQKEIGSSQNLTLGSANSLNL